MSWEQFLIQLPIVAAFVYYSLELQKRFTESMDKRDAAYLQTLERISNNIECINQTMLLHDQRVDERIDAARETKPINRRAKS